MDKGDLMDRKKSLLETYDKDGIYYHHSDDKLGYYDPQKEYNGNEGEKHGYLKDSLLFVLETHFNADGLSEEKQVNGTRVDCFGEGLKRFSGEVGKFNCRSRDIMDRFRDIYEFSDVLLWIPYTGNQLTNSIAPPYVQRIMDHSLQSEGRCRLYPLRCSTGWLSKIPRIVIRHEKNLYQIYLIDLEHLFDPKKWHMKNNEIYDDKEETKEKEIQKPEKCKHYEDGMCVYLPQTGNDIPVPHMCKVKVYLETNDELIYCNNYTV